MKNLLALSFTLLVSSNLFAAENTSVRSLLNHSKNGTLFSLVKNQGELDCEKEFAIVEDQEITNGTAAFLHFGDVPLAADSTKQNARIKYSFQNDEGETIELDFYQEMNGKTLTLWFGEVNMLTWAAVFNPLTNKIDIVSSVWDENGKLNRTTCKYETK